MFATSYFSLGMLVARTWSMKETVKLAQKIICLSSEVLPCVQAVFKSPAVSVLTCDLGTLKALIEGL